jgi:hypothetical protein
VGKKLVDEDPSSKPEKRRKPRFRLGPQRLPEDRHAEEEIMVALRHEAERLGELVVDLPPLPATRFTDPETGQEVGLDNGPDHTSWVHPTVSQLGLLAREFLDVALEHANGEAAAVGHIVRALYRAIDQNDLDALNAPQGPHTWARRYLRETGGSMLPVEDSRGRLLEMSQLSGGFRRLAQLIQWSIEMTRPRAMALDSYPFLGRIAWMMASWFPSVPSLAGPDPARDEKAWRRIDEVAARISNVLRLRGEERRHEPPESLAPDIAEELLQNELRLSGKTTEEIRAAFGFRNH